MSEAERELEKPITVVAVREGLRSEPAGRPCRVFSVIVSRACGDAAVAATAIDPTTGLAIPAAGDAHPDRAGYVAEPPEIFSVGVRAKGGPLLQTCSPLLNVRVRYRPEGAQP